MGNSWSGQSSGDQANRRQKRKLEEEAEETEKIIQTELNTPKKKKLRSTSKYIYQTLFVNGENSDVTIVALGREWRLHRIYLCQADYFSSMFSGSWRESEQKSINISIPDDNIDQEALDIAFGSLYQDDVTITPNHVVSVLSAATLLGIDGLIQQCANIIQETISAATVCQYYQASITYGLQGVQQSCISWLERNLLSAQSVPLLNQLSADLMVQIVSSPDLFVIQVEVDLYSLLKKWTFLQLTDDWNGSLKELQTESNTFFQTQKSKHQQAFLDTEIGQPFGEVFRSLRLWHIVNDASSTKILEEDSIIPLSWLLPVYRDQWHQLLGIEQGIDVGPEGEEHPGFSEQSLRVGRVLVQDAQYCWRWTGFNYGIDILVYLSNRLLKFKRNCHGLNCVGSVSHAQQRRFIYRVNIASLNNKGQSSYSKTTGIKMLSLGRDEEAIVLNIDRQMEFPIHISANFLFYTPVPNRLTNKLQILSVGQTCPLPSSSQSTTASVSTESTGSQDTS